MSGEGIGFGKAILLNEHFVVYGIPSIVSAIGKYTISKVDFIPQSGWKIIDNRKATPKYKEDKVDQQNDSINRMLEKLNIDLSKKGIEITLEGSLYCASGVGASAASCVAIIRALSDLYELNLTDDEINDVAYEGEKGYHGNPSGIDNSASTYGGLIWFEKGEKSKMEKIIID